MASNTFVRLVAAKTVTGVSSTVGARAGSPQDASASAATTAATAFFIVDHLQSVRFHHRPGGRAFPQLQVGKRFGRYT